jgi:hypothetical protein
MTLFEAACGAARHRGLTGSATLADRCLSRSALTGMTGCQMALTSWPDAARIRWRVGRRWRVRKGRSGGSDPGGLIT